MEYPWSNLERSRPSLGRRGACVRYAWSQAQQAIWAKGLSKGPSTSLCSSPEDMMWLGVYKFHALHLSFPTTFCKSTGRHCGGLIPVCRIKCIKPQNTETKMNLVQRVEQVRTARNTYNLIASFQLIYLFERQR